MAKTKTRPLTPLTIKTDVRNMDFKEYIKELDRLYCVGNTTEHSFRGSLQSFLSELLPGYVVTNEPRRQECGAPDYVITKKGVP